MQGGRLERILIEYRMAGIRAGGSWRSPGSKKLRSKLRTKSRELPGIG